jgi:hypothetical protein
MERGRAASAPTHFEEEIPVIEWKPKGNGRIEMRMNDRWASVWPVEAQDQWGWPKHWAWTTSEGQHRASGNEPTQDAACEAALKDIEG